MEKVQDDLIVVLKTNFPDLSFESSSKDEWAKVPFEQIQKQDPMLILGDYKPLKRLNLPKLWVCDMLDKDSKNNIWTYLKMIVGCASGKLQIREKDKRGGGGEEKGEEKRGTLKEKEVKIDELSNKEVLAVFLKEIPSNMPQDEKAFLLKVIKMFPSEVLRNMLKKHKLEGKSRSTQDLGREIFEQLTPEVLDKMMKRAQNIFNGSDPSEIMSMFQKFAKY